MAFVIIHNKRPLTSISEGKLAEAVDLGVRQSMRRIGPLFQRRIRAIIRNEPYRTTMARALRGSMSRLELQNSIAWTAEHNGIRVGAKGNLANKILSFWSTGGYIQMTARRRAFLAAKGFPVSASVTSFTVRPSNLMDKVMEAGVLEEFSEALIDGIRSEVQKRVG